MSHECHHGSCSHEGHHFHEHGCCSCSANHQCGCNCHRHHHKYSDELLDLADEAWMEVVKEKIKEEIRQHSGEHISKLAKLVAESNHSRWNHILSEKKNHEDFEKNLRNLVSPNPK